MYMYMYNYMPTSAPPLPTPPSQPPPPQTTTRKSGSLVMHTCDLPWYSGSTELAPSGLATPILTGALEASAASDRLFTASHENWPRIRLHDLWTFEETM